MHSFFFRFQIAPSLKVPASFFLLPAPLIPHSVLYGFFLYF
jgi:hypothetical protein